MTAHPSKVINIFESRKETREDGLIELDLAAPFDLSRISIRYYRIPPKKTFTGVIPIGIAQLCYVLEGCGILSVGESGGGPGPEVEVEAGTEESAESISVNQDDCFSFRAAEEGRDRLWKVTTEGVLGGCGLLVVSDVAAYQPEGGSGINKDKGGITSQEKEREQKATTSLPTLVHAPTSGKWFVSTKRVVKGVEHCYATRLADITDIGLAPPSANTNTGSSPPTKFWGFNRERIPPGTQSSYAHTHSSEDELVLVLSGKARYWHHGEEPERVLKRGDCIGWKAGTGICHALLNDASDENGTGEDLVMLIWGEDKPVEDRVWYAATSPPWFTPNHERKWVGWPKVPFLGDASPEPRFPRPDDRPLPTD